MCDCLQNVLTSGCESPLLLSLLTCIPKPGRSTNDAANLRPISVSSVWYRVLMKIFVMRLTPLLPHILSADQHGFCPGRNCMTALATVLPVVDAAVNSKSDLLLMQLDIDKAYDSVDRAAMLGVLQYIGVTNNPFYRVL